MDDDDKIPQDGISFSFRYYATLKRRYKYFATYLYHQNVTKYLILLNFLLFIDKRWVTIDKMWSKSTHRSSFANIDKKNNELGSFVMDVSKSPILLFHTCTWKLTIVLNLFYLSFKNVKSGRRNGEDIAKPKKNR